MMEMHVSVLCCASPYCADASVPTASLTSAVTSTTRCCRQSGTQSGIAPHSDKCLLGLQDAGECMMHCNMTNLSVESIP